MQFKFQHIQTPTLIPDVVTHFKIVHISLNNCPINPTSQINQLHNPAT